MNAPLKSTKQNINNGGASSRRRFFTVPPKPRSSWRQRFGGKIEQLRSQISEKYKNEFAEIERDNKERIDRREIELFSHIAIRYCVFLAAVIIFFAILFVYAAPPRGIIKALEGKEYISIPDAELCFGEGCLNDPARIHKIKLPFLNISSLPDYQDHDLFYRIKPNFGAEQLKGGMDTLVIPRAWGDAIIYRSGTVIAARPNLRPIVFIENPDDEIVVHIRKPSGGKFGIRGISPPFVCDRQLARELEDELNGEPFQIQYSYVAQLSGLWLFLVTFLTFPYRPELFAFLALFGIETLRSSIWHLNDRGEVLFSPLVDTIICNSLLVAATLTTVFFVGLFFRCSIRKILRFFAKNSLKFAGTAFASYFLLSSICSRLNGESTLFIVLWLLAFLISTLLITPILLYLFTNGPRNRVFLGISVLGIIAYWAGRNVYDRLLPEWEIHTEYTNHLHFFFFMAIVLAIEIGRTEVRIKEAYSLLPRDVVRLINIRKESWKEGFVILLDVVGWSSMLRSLEASETPEFMRKVNEYLLSHFDDPGVSVVTGTGDGFYLTYEGELTDERFQMVTDACIKLARNRPSFHELGLPYPALRDKRIIVRSAIGYGQYYAGLAKTEHLKKDFLAGFIATLLARVIGNDKNPTGPKILVESPLDKYRGRRLIFTQETKGDKVEYWLLD